MTGPRQRPAWVLLAWALAATTGLVTLAALLSRGALLVHQCVPADGLAGRLGLRMALLRSDALCPTDSLAVGADSGRVMGVVVLVALPVLAAHLTGLGLGLGLAARVRRLARAAATVLRTVLRVLPVPDRLPARPRGALPDAVVPLVRDRLVVDVPWQRGPPAPRFA